MDFMYHPLRQGPLLLPEIYHSNLFIKFQITLINSIFPLFPQKCKCYYAGLVQPNITKINTTKKLPTRLGVSLVNPKINVLRTEVHDERP
jgi:hypothetical protein